MLGFAAAQPNLQFFCVVIKHVKSLFDLLVFLNNRKPLSRLRKTASALEGLLGRDKQLLLPINPLSPNNNDNQAFQSRTPLNY